MENSTDKLARAYSTLKALKDNIPANRVVDNDLVVVYHRALDHLTELGFDVAEFRIAANAFQRMGSAVWVDRTLVMVKLDAVLGYFVMKSHPQESSIGFKMPPGKRKAKGL